MDNHIATQGQKEYEDKSNCPNCGHHTLVEIDWCDNDHIECCQDCNSFHEGFDCPVRVAKLRCDKCESVFEGN